MLCHWSPTSSPGFDNLSLSNALAELTELAGCAERSWVTDCDMRYNTAYPSCLTCADPTLAAMDSFALTGSDVGGRRLWRLSFDAPRSASNAARADGGGLSVSGLSVGKQRPGAGGSSAVGARECSLWFAQGQVLSPANATGGPHERAEGTQPAGGTNVVGVWIAQPTSGTVEVRCGERSPETWPLVRNTRPLGSVFDRWAASDTPMAL